MNQFYTKTNVSNNMYAILNNKIDLNSFDILLEPSAGTGSFFKLMNKNKRVGIDLEPKCDGVKKCNFFDYTFIPNKKYAVIGNPPFGKRCSTAIKFFNRSAMYADLIAFIIPRTFKRVSVQNRLNLYFELIHSIDLPTKPCCFEPKMKAKCCFQIWIRRTKPRKITRLTKKHKDFDFIKLGRKDENNQPTKPVEAHFGIVAYGGECGRITFDDSMCAKNCHWIKSNIDIDLLIKRFNSLDYSISKDTVRQNSIGRGELVHLYSNHY